VAGLSGLTGTQAADKTATTQTTQAVRGPRVPMPAQVLDQISVQVDKAVKDGNDTVKIQLRPLDLGRIEIKLDVGSDGKVSATVTADKPETLAMLQKDSRGLEKALEDAGLKPDSSATSFNLRGGEQQQNADRNADQGRSGRNRGQGGQFGGDADDLAAAAAIQAAATRTAGGRSGVDISV
jgi:flagellar hook-length control protein FliK